MTEQKSKLLFLIFIFTCAISVVGTNDSYGGIIPSDRKIPWNPGIPGGIPSRTTIYANVNNAPYNAHGDDSHDDTNAIQNAINDCPEGQVVYLPAGTYKITDELIIAKGITLRGAGPESTKIRIHSTSVWHAIRIGNWGSTTETSVTGSPTKGSTSITVSDASSFSVGDYVLIDQENDSGLVDRGDCTWCGRDSGNRCMGQLIEIMAKNGNTLTIDPGLYYSYSSTYNPEIVLLSSSVVENAGIEDLYVERVSPGGYENIRLQYCAYCWVKNVESYNAYERHIQLRRTFKCEVRDSYIHHGHDYNGGHAYGVSLFDHTTDALVENNIFYYLRHSMVLEGGPAGCVFGYNFSDRMFDNNYPNTNWLMADFSTHGAHPHMNLFEGNIGNHIGEDYTHGSASHNTYFRNWVDRESEGEDATISSHLICVDIHKYNYYISIVGNILGQSGDSGNYEAEGIDCIHATMYVYKLGYTSDGDCGAAGNDYNVKSILLRHGNYDYVTQSTQWDPNIQDHNLPNSYYLSSKPAFFGSLPWPPFGPDLEPKVGQLPAKKRFDAIQGDMPPSPPRNLRIIQ